MASEGAHVVDIDCFVKIPLVRVLIHERAVCAFLLLPIVSDLDNDRYLNH